MSLGFEEAHFHAGELDHVVVDELARLAADGGAVHERVVVGLVGVHVHNLKDADSEQSAKGRNPFAHFRMKRDGSALSSLAKVYDPPFNDSKQ